MSAPSKHARLVAAAVPLALALSTAIGAAGARVARADSPNLIVNGDAETGLCSQSGYEEMTIPGWTVTSGGPNEVCFTNTGGFPPASAPGAQPGNAYFTGGTDGDLPLGVRSDDGHHAARPGDEHRPGQRDRVPPAHGDGGRAGDDADRAP